MKKLLALTFVLNLLLGSYGFAASQTTTKEDKIVKAIHHAAIKDKWTKYTPSVHSETQTLYFKKKIKNKNYYTYRYQNRHKNKEMTVYAKVNYRQNNVKVEFVDKISMNPGRLGIDNKVDKVLNELTDAIELELSSNG